VRLEFDETISTLKSLQSKIKCSTDKEVKYDNLISPFVVPDLNKLPETRELDANAFAGLQQT
jgi:hypothetical protein